MMMIRMMSRIGVESMGMNRLLAFFKSKKIFAYATCMSNECNLFFFFLLYIKGNKIAVSVSK